MNPTERQTNTIRMLYSAFCRIRKIEPDSLKVKNRNADLIFEKSLFYASVQVLNQVYPKYHIKITSSILGAFFSQDHATVLQSRKRFLELCEIDDRYDLALQEIVTKLKIHEDFNDNR